MGALRRRNLVKVIITGRRLDIVDRDHLGHIVARQFLICQVHQSNYIAVMGLEVRTAYGRAEKGRCGHEPIHDI